MSLSPEELAELTGELDSLEIHHAVGAPRNNDELHAWILENTGVNIPRVAVCEGHNAPFDFIADAFFGRTKAAVVLANREGMKTLGIACLWVAMAKFIPGVEMLTAGAIEAQAKRLYTHTKNLLSVKGVKDDLDLKHHPDLVEPPMQSLCRWRNGSELEICTGSVKSMNGPHPNKFHFDEQDLCDPAAWEESRNISSSRGNIGKQDFVTSTRKSKHGPMQKLLDEIAEAKRLGTVSPYDLYAWCFVETNENVPNCQVANPDLPDEEKCNCHLVIKGTWDDGTPRRFDQVCKGRLAKSQGYAPLSDTQGVFLQTSRGTWEAQRECIKPDVEGLVFHMFSPGRHGIRHYQPDPDNGPLFMHVDWGGAESQQAVGWYQLLRYEIDVAGFDGKAKRLKQGTLVLFDELYELGIGNAKLADMVIEREREYRQIFPNFKVSYRFPDPQGAAARLDFKDKGLPTYWNATRDIKSQIKICKGRLEEDKFAVDVIRCGNFLDEMEYYHYPKKKAGMIDDPEIPVDDFNHMVAGWRYTEANLDRMLKKGKAMRGHQPRAAGEGYAPVGGAKNIPVASGGRRYAVQVKRGMGP